MIVKWVARKIEEHDLFEISFQDHEQNHAAAPNNAAGRGLHMSALTRQTWQM